MNKTVNILVFLTTGLLCLLILELVLRTGIFDDINNPKMVWMPEKYKKMSRDINSCLDLFSKNNEFGFTDIPREQKKKDGTFRIMVLGDSFIWGAGVLPETVWSRKLERMMQKEEKNIEVISWGKPGWQTIDEYNFFTSEGYKYDPDLLIIGFVDNDVDLKDLEFSEPTYPILGYIMPIKNVFPNSVEFIGAYLNNFLTKNFLKGKSYEDWLGYVYSDNNLKRYGQVLKDFAGFARDKKTKLLFVFTPNYYDKRMREEYDKVIPLFKEVGIEYLDLYPIVVKNLSQYSPRQLWTNPVDPHPGELLTSLYAEEVFKYLKMKTF